MRSKHPTLLWAAQLPAVPAAATDTAYVPPPVHTDAEFLPGAQSPPGEVVPLPSYPAPYYGDP